MDTDNQVPVQDNQLASYNNDPQNRKKIRHALRFAITSRISQLNITDRILNMPIRILSL